MLHHLSSIAVCTYGLISVVVQPIAAAKPDATRYPIKFDLAPSNTTWNTLFLTGDIPNLPVTSGPSLSPNFTKEVTRCNNDNDWGLTFDDGPTENTQIVLDALAANNVKATFFVIGSRVLDGWEYLKAVHDAGHQIGIHTWSHRSLTTLTNDQIVAELVWTAAIIKEVIGVTPIYFRPPYDDMDDRVRAIVKNMGLTAVVWSFAPGDTDGRTDVAERMAARANSAVRNGTISLMHDFSLPYAIQAPGAIDAVRQAGFNIQTVASCLESSAVYNESIWKKLSMPFVTHANTTSVPTTSSTTTGTTGSATPNNNGASKSANGSRSGHICVATMFTTVALTFGLAAALIQ
ncbi:hypothetical protein BSLG_009375 [Batrachochytrium salamandrivorans]|nr:hypothetical protein BSLG_009375 [Batrachochytrium salamandrivorans]